MERLRLSAWGRVFRRLQRSVGYTDAQKASIWRRQIALGVRSPRITANSVVESVESKVLEDVDEETEVMAAHAAKSLRSPIRAGASTKKSTPYSSVASGSTRALSSTVSFSSIVPPPPPGSSISYVDVAEDPNFIRYESDESGDEHRPEPAGELIVAVRVCIAALSSACLTCSRLLVHATECVDIGASPRARGATRTRF